MNSILSEKMQYLITYAEKQYDTSKGLHLNSKDWESYITIGTPLYYSFLINGIVKYNTKSKISGERYEQILKMSEYKKMESPLMILFLLNTPEDVIANYIAMFLTVSEAKLFCPCKAFCLDKDTKIDLADDRVLTIKELYEEYNTGVVNYVYSIDKNNNPTVNKINKVWISGKVKDMIRITLDNGQYIDTTPEHYYILRNGIDIMAKDLDIGDSLMPIYFNDNKKGYKTVKLNSTGKYKYKNKTVHRLVAEKYSNDVNKYDKRTVIHHVDFNKRNNNPENLIAMDKIEHLKYHGKHINKNRDKVNEGYWKWLDYMKENKPEELKELRSRGGLATYKKHPEMYDKNRLANWVKNNGDIISDYRKNYWNNNPEAKERVSIISKSNWKNDNIREKMLNGINQSWDKDRRKKQSKTISKRNTEGLNEIINKSPNHIISCKLGSIFKTIDELILNNKKITENSFEECRKNRKGINWNKVFNNFDEVLYNYNFYIKNKKINKKEIISNILQYNHKIINIEYISYDNESDVYDMEIENDHNFYVNAGVVLHNSYWGVHYNLTQLDSAYGKGENRPPNTRDENRDNLVCKHLWLVLDNYKDQINTFAKGLIPYYRRCFGLTNDAGVERTREQLGQRGMKNIVIQATRDLNGLGNKELIDFYNKLTTGKLNEIFTTEVETKPAENFDNIKTEQKNDKQKEVEDKVDDIKVDEKSVEETKTEEKKAQEEKEASDLISKEEEEKKAKELEEEKKRHEVAEAEAKDKEALMNKLILNQQNSLMEDDMINSIKSINKFIKE